MILILLCSSFLPVIYSSDLCDANPCVLLVHVSSDGRIQLDLHSSCYFILSYVMQIQLNQQAPMTRLTRLTRLDIAEITANQGAITYQHHVRMILRSSCRPETRCRISRQKECLKPDIPQACSGSFERPSALFVGLVTCCHPF